MEKQKHIIIFSHGFGVKKDDRGLLTAIADAFPESATYLFDYFDVNEEDMTIAIRPFTEQMQILNNVYKKAKETHPNAIIDIIAHSQGTLIPSLLKLEGIRKTILLTPVFDMGIERTIKRYGSDPESEINMEGISKLRKLDGYIRYVPSEYWIERKELNPFYLYNEYSLKTDLIIINANQDNILGSVDISLLDSNIKVLNLDGDHEFSGDQRKVLIQKIGEIILLK
jgi:hypothetical protein